ncbi:MAG: hypothetical protein EOM68_32115 [Spirochaetia bacterium]|nr:hypothetical protein [Spirochaetia bacterium]
MNMQGIQLTASFRDGATTLAAVPTGFAPTALTACVTVKQVSQTPFSDNILGTYFSLTADATAGYTTFQLAGPKTVIPVSAGISDICQAVSIDSFATVKTFKLTAAGLSLTDNAYLMVSFLPCVLLRHMGNLLEWNPWIMPPHRL